MTAATDGLLDTTTGAMTALLIEGDAGIGKTTAWFHIVDHARAQGFRVLMARPDQTESVLPFASLSDLLGDVDPDEWSELPEPQRLAIDRALLRIGVPSDATDGRALGVGFLSIVSRLAALAPVLVAVDDVQWLDTPTRNVIAFAARRFSGAVRVVCTVRSGDRGVGADWLTTSRPDSLMRARVGPLGPRDLHRALAQRYGRPFTLSSVARIHAISGGNPFYAIELARTLTPGSEVEAAFPETLAELVQNRIRGIDRDGLEVLFVTACVAEPTVELVARTLEVEAVEVVRRIDALGVDRIVEVDGQRLRFVHPLLSRGVYSNAPPGRRRAMHRRLAVVVEQPELRARHLALAATTGDAETVAALDVAADIARRRGAPDTSAELTGLAIRLGGDTPTRRIALAHDHFNAGDIARARDVLDDLAGRVDVGVHRAPVLGLLAVVRMFDDSFTEAVDLLGKALAEVADDAPVRAELLIAQAFALANSDRVDEGVCSADDAVIVAHRLHRSDLESQALGMRTTLRFMRGDGLDADSLQRAIELGQHRSGAPIPFRPQAQSALLSAWTGDLDVARDQLETVRRDCAAHGEEIELAFIAFHASIFDIWRGDIPAASDEADRMTERATQLGGEMPAFVALSMRSMVDAYAGSAHTARRDALSALAAGGRWGSSTLSNWPRTILGFLDLSLDRFGDALETLAPMIASVREHPDAVEIITASFVPDAIEAMIRVGRLDEADDLVTILETAGARLDRAWTLAVGARCRSALCAARGDLVGARQAGERALVEHTRLAMPFELARTQMVVGEVFRRDRHKEASASMLTDALAAFESMGTPLWSERARRALTRVGVGAHSDTALTPSEQRVADLAASGMINRDIASTLFISPKTVEANLARVYRKLGIHSRAQLGARIGSR